MVIVLYDKDETLFNDMGLGILTDVISCEVTEQLNGEFELEMEYPIGGILFNELKEERIILSKSNPYDDPQPFRIYEIGKPIEGSINVSARHVHYDMNSIGTSTNVSNINTLWAAITAIKTSIIGDNNRTKWTFAIDPSSTFESKNYASLTEPHQLNELIFDDGDDCILNVYDAEVKYNKFSCTFYKKRGSNRNVKIEYGKNITSMTHTVNSENCYTGIMPYYSQDVTNSSSSKSQQFTPIYVVPGVEPYTYGWLSLEANRNLRSQAKIDAYNDSNLYLITKDASDAGMSDVDPYLSHLVMQTNEIDKTIFWKQVPKDELPDGVYINPALKHCCVVDGVSAYSQYWFATSQYDADDPTSKTLIEMSVYGEQPGPDEIGYGQYIYVEHVALHNKNQNDEKYVGYYYTPAVIFNREEKFEYPGYQWGTKYYGIYALFNTTDDEPKILDGWASIDGTTPAAKVDLINGAQYVCVNQYIKSNGEVNTKFGMPYYALIEPLIGSSRFDPDKSLISTILSKVKKIFKSVSNTIHKSFMLIDANENIAPRYFDGHSASDLYQKIIMVDVSNEFSEAPISNADFTEKVQDWLNKHIKDYDHNDITIDTSFIMLADDLEYASILNKEIIEIGDTITIVCSKLGIKDEKRVVETVYDVINNKYTSVTLQKEEDDEI